MNELKGKGKNAENQQRIWLPGDDLVQLPERLSPEALKMRFQWEKTWRFRACIFYRNLRSQKQYISFFTDSAFWRVEDSIQKRRKGTRAQIGWKDVSWYEWQRIMPCQFFGTWNLTVKRFEKRQGNTCVLGSESLADFNQEKWSLSIKNDEFKTLAFLLML